MERRNIIDIKGKLTILIKKEKLKRQDLEKSYEAWTTHCRNSLILKQ